MHAAPLGSSSEKPELAAVIRLGVVFFWIFLMGCVQQEPCNGPFSLGVALGKNRNHDLEEASGLVASVRYPGHYWTHNDSGHPAELFLIDSTCHTVSQQLVPGAENRDWEDIAWGPGPSPNTRYLYIGDIGDNQKQYPVKVIYRISEPAIDAPINPASVAVQYVQLPDKVRDTEAMFADPVSGDFYLLSKHEKNVHLYRFAAGFAGDTVVAVAAGNIPFTEVVAADMSADGSELLVKSYGHIYYWRRKNGEPIEEMVKNTPITLCYRRESIGEAIAWNLDGSAFLTLGENARGERSSLYRYHRQD